MHLKTARSASLRLTLRVSKFHTVYHTNTKEYTLFTKAERRVWKIVCNLQVLILRGTQKTMQIMYSETPVKILNFKC